jgi:hypothetical protein
MSMSPYIKLPDIPLEKGRTRIILEKSAGKRVLHLGCVDTGLLESRFAQGQLMHQQLQKVATELWGLDINVEGLAFLRAHGFDNLVEGDVSALDEVPELEGEAFDVLVASEIMEHLLNPGLFLSSVKSLMVPGHTELIITVPNAFRVSTLAWLLRGIEYVHPDHNYWFSYHTLTTLLQKNDFAIQGLYVYALRSTRLLPPLFRRSRTFADPSPSSPPVSRRALAYLRSFPLRLVAGLLYRRSPFWGDGLIAVVQVPDDERE